MHEPLVEESLASPRCAQLGNKDETPGPGTTCVQCDIGEVALAAYPELLNCSLFQTGPPAAHPIIFIHSAVHSQSPFLQHLQCLLCIYEKSKSTLHSFSFSPPFQLCLPKQPLHPPAPVSPGKALHEPATQNSLLLLSAQDALLSPTTWSTSASYAGCKGQAC